MARTALELTAEELLAIWELTALSNWVYITKDGSGNLVWIKYNLSASTAPTITDDSSEWYAVWSIWIDTTADKAYVCLDSTDTVAVWEQINNRLESIQIACSDLTTALITWTNVAYFRMPYAFYLIDVRASLIWAWSTSWVTTIDLNKNWTTILSTKLTIDYWEKTSTTAGTPVVISDNSLTNDSEITIDIDWVTWWADKT